MGVLKKTAAIAIVAGVMALAAFGIGALKDRVANSEIDQTDYTLVSTWAFNEKLGPAIKKATADGRITQAEFSQLTALKEKVEREEIIIDIDGTVDDVKTIKELRDRVEKLSKEMED